MRFLTVQYTNPGGRTPNEDAVGFFDNEKFYAWIAADGLGGHLHGEIASAAAVQSLEDGIKSCTRMDEESIKATFRKMNADIRELKGPLTTAACAFSDGEKLWYGNNGDSRFFFIRDREILYHSNDHSLAYLAYTSGAISYDEIAAHPGQNRLYHSMGNEIEYFGEIYSPIELKPGDAFILCTDGFWELVDRQEMVRTLNISPTPQEWLSMLLDILEQRLKPTSDNYSAVCVIVRED